MRSIRIGWLVAALVAAVGVTTVLADDGAPESKRLARAKDFIYDEQWPRAVEELRAAVADRAETRRDEAMYWLAYSLHQSGDAAAAVEMINQLEREFPKSLWVKPARSLRIEIAVRLNRSDVLWWTAMPPPPGPRKVPSPAQRPKGPDAVPPPAQADTKPPKAIVVPPPPPKVWLDPESFNPDPDLQILALSGLLKTDAAKVIPMLGEIAWQGEDPGRAGRALFMLAQSELPEARELVIQVAKAGPEPVRVAAVKEFGRFAGPDVSKELVQMYQTAMRPVKLQVLKSLGERSEKGALVKIVTSEKEAQLQRQAITCLAQAGGADQLATMYRTFGPHARQSVIVGLFSVRADGELVQIAQIEKDAALRQIALDRLRVLGTPKAKDYLQKVSEKR